MITLHTNFGDIKIALNHEKAPITAENFLKYCQSGFYNNTIFHLMHQFKTKQTTA